MNHVATSPAVAENVTAVVIQPSTFTRRLFTCSPMTERLLVRS